MWKDILLYGLPAYAALIVSGIVLWLDIHRYYLHLKMRIPHVTVVWHKNSTSIVLFDLSFVNPASKGKTVNTLKLKPPFEIEYEQHPFVFSKGLQTAFCPVPNAAGRRWEFPIGQVLQLPLDIPPNESRSGLYAVDLSEIPSIEQAGVWENKPLPWHLYAFDIDNK